MLIKVFLNSFSITKEFIIHCLLSSETTHRAFKDTKGGIPSCGFRISGERVHRYKGVDVALLIFSHFLAHLSQRLMAELIVYQSLRRPSVRPQFQTSSPLKPLGQLKSNYIWRLLRTRERKFVQMVLVT